MRLRVLASLSILTALIVVGLVVARAGAQSPTASVKTAPSNPPSLAVQTRPGSGEVASKRASATKAEKWTAPRTSWGEPDLQGVWSYATITPLERPENQAGKDVLTDEAVHGGRTLAGH